MTKTKQTPSNLLNLGVEQIIGLIELRKTLKEGRKLRIKHGVDPTGNELHLGHAAVYQKMREFQKLGHKIIFLIGDFTGRFGDPTEKVRMRQLRSKKEVRQTAKNYLKQVGEILDLKKVEVRYNSEWWDKMKAGELLQLMSHFSHAQLIERDMFQERIKRGINIGLHEIVYPILQGYDSVMLKSDLTIIGSDQLFNEMRGRDLQKDFGQKPQIIMTVPLLIGTDGKQKMSQSLGNQIALNASPDEKFGKIMSIPDRLILQYAELAGRYQQKELKSLKKHLKEKNPRDLKMTLAEKIVALYHGPKKAEAAKRRFIKIFREKKTPSKIPVQKAGADLVTLLHHAHLVSSRSEARRLIAQKAIDVNKKTITDPYFTPFKGDIIKIGKKRFLQIV